MSLLFKDFKPIYKLNCRTTKTGRECCKIPSAVSGSLQAELIPDVSCTVSTCSSGCEREREEGMSRRNRREMKEGFETFVTEKIEKYIQ